MEDEQIDDTCSIIMLGDAGVGKSWISVTFKSGKSAAKDINTTIGIDLWTKVVNIDHKSIKAVIYDTSGQERFRSIPKGYIRKGDGIIIVYDITDRTTFESMAYWLQEVETLRSDKPPIIILGNKSDLDSQRQVRYTEGKEIAESCGAYFEETTIQKPDSIEHAFQIIIKTVYIHRVERPTEFSMKSKKNMAKKNLSSKHYLDEVKETAKIGGRKCEW